MILHDVPIFAVSNLDILIIAGIALVFLMLAIKVGPLLPLKESLMTMSDADLLRAAQALDASYASAAEFDAKKLAEWIEEKFELFTKRTDYPKLGWIINQLNERGIASIVHGKSFHAPLLYVEFGKLDAAMEILSDGWDEMDDDDPQFAPFANTQPDTDLYA